MITIATFFPEYLNDYGSYGDILAIQKMLEHSNITYKIIHIYQDTELIPDEIDFFYIGSNSVNTFESCLPLFKSKIKLIKSLLSNDCLGIICGFSVALFGDNYNDSLGEQKNGLKLFNYSVNFPSKIKSSWTSFSSSFGGMKYNYTGLFVDDFFITSNLPKFAKLKKTPNSTSLGVWINNTIITTSIGTLLIRNPILLNLIVSKLLTKKGFPKAKPFNFTQASSKITKLLKN